MPDHSWLSRTRTRLPHEVHAAVFDWVLVLITEAGLVKGDCIGVDASTRNIVRRATGDRVGGEGYREMLERLARESGIETPTAEDLVRLDRQRKDKKLSNEDWVSKSDPEVRIAKMKDRTTHLAYKPEHAVDLASGAVVAAELRCTLPTRATPRHWRRRWRRPRRISRPWTRGQRPRTRPNACDKGYHSRAVLKALDVGPWKTRICEPKQTGFARWRGDQAARRVVVSNRTRLSELARQAFKLRAEIVERSFAHNFDRGGLRRTWLRGRENVHKRYLLQVAGHSLSLLMRQLIGAGTPREAVAGGSGGIFVLHTPTGAILVALAASESGQTAFAAAVLIWE